MCNISFYFAFISHHCRLRHSANKLERGRKMFPPSHFDDWANQVKREGERMILCATFVVVPFRDPTKSSPQPIGSQDPELRVCVCKRETGRERENEIYICDGNEICNNMYIFICTGTTCIFV